MTKAIQAVETDHLNEEQFHEFAEAAEREAAPKLDTRPTVSAPLPAMTRLEAHRRRNQQYRKTQEQSWLDAEATGGLWTIYASMRIDAHKKRTAFVVAYHGRRDDQETRDAFDSQNDGTILMGPRLIVSDRAHLAHVIAKMFIVDELTLRWIGGSKW